MKVTLDEYLDIFLETLINRMIKNGYETINIDQLMNLKHVFKKDPLEALKN